MDIDPLRAVLSRRPLGLFSDIDGTLSPIVERPEDAAVTPRSRSLLERLIREGVRVALITGRPLASAQAMVGIDNAAYAANHGLEFWVNGTSKFKGDGGDYYALLEQVGHAVDELESMGITMERKGQGVAFHYRQASDEVAARARIEAAIRRAPAAKDFRWIEGRKVIELRPDIEASKGTATRGLASQLEVQGLVCLGDDRTDVAMFEAAHALARRAVRAESVAVLSPEIHPDVLGAADYAVEGVQGVEWLLGEILKAVGATSR